MNANSAPPRDEQFLACSTNGQSYLINRRWVRDVRPGVSPGDHDGTMPIFALPRLLGGEVTSRTKQQQVIPLETPRGRWGLLVDCVAQDVRVAPESMVALPPCLAHWSAIEAVHHVRGASSLMLFPPALLPKDGDIPQVPITRSPSRSNRTLPALPLPPGGTVALKKLLLCPIRTPGLAGRALSLGLSVVQVNEVIAPESIIRLPGAQPPLVGLTVWRNLALPVFDFTTKLQNDSATGAARMVIARATKSLEPAALVARSPFHVLRLPVASMPARRSPAIDARYLRGAFELPDLTVAVPDLDLLTADSQRVPQDFGPHRSYNRQL
jgi:chemotaxis signal transduction protein